MPERDPAAIMADQRPRALPATVFASATARGICVVGIGASAGGLDACKRFLLPLPATPGMAFILVQHMDPTHESMMVELLSDASPTPVLQAADGMKLQADHLYVNPPGVYLSVNAGALRLSPPRERHGARLPFDFFLHTLAADAGNRAVCVILSGSGADGAIGLAAIKAAGGLVIAQAPEDAGYDGMPRNAIATGQVDFVLAVDEIAPALLKYKQTFDAPVMADGLTRIIALLRDKTPHDFTAYKPGTLERRIARRMGIAGIAPGDADGYLHILQDNEAERDRLATDLLINVTSFFRDPKIFGIVASFIPELITNAGDRPIRIWIAGCSTGEETYSLAILFQEQIRAVGSAATLQIFASDVDAAAVAVARDGFYPKLIEAQVTQDRLGRFFTSEDHGYRIAASLRGNIVFAVQDVLADPPFSKLDFISCRNLLIYLRPHAQAKVISIFNFALRTNGILLLGSAETAGNAEGKFTTLSKPARLYRKISTDKVGGLAVATGSREPLRALGRTAADRPLARGPDLADICKRLVLDAYAPASMLLNLQLESLYSFGPAERYLRVAPGYPTHDVTAMIRPALRARFKAAADEAVKSNIRVVMPGGRAMRDGLSLAFNIELTPVMHEGAKFLLVCFVNQPKSVRRRSGPPAPASTVFVRELEEELSVARRDLQAALHALEVSAQEQNIIREEALSINEEFQSTNEELLTSKEELQSLNEELTALNSQLQETLERSRMTSNDLQNVLYSTDVATLFLDIDLNIRFFTPATKSLFTLIPGDLGRPLADLHALATDDALHDDANLVLKQFISIEREVQTENGNWFNRRILPYRTHDNHVAGVVITFTDITERKIIAANLLAAQLKAEQANITKSRFLAAASHDLRQPMQTLTLLTGLLEKAVENSPARALLQKLDETTDAMTGILNTLLDINQIDAGIIKADIVSYPVGRLLERLGREFIVLAQARGLTLRVVPCGLRIRTDPRILEQMLRNLISNAVKYTSQGGVLLGCRRHGKRLAIEVWDTGLGIPAAELEAIFDEYHQVDNTARERSRGLGLGLSIVRRLGGLLDHTVSVRSAVQKGSVFAIQTEISVPRIQTSADESKADTNAASHGDTGNILVIEDDPDIRQLLQMFLTEEGHQVAVARDGETAYELIRDGTIRPDLILADYNLPNGADGLQVVAKLRQMLKYPVAVIIVTGDISTETMRRIALTECVQINKPMKLLELNDVIGKSLGGVTVRQSRTPPPSRLALPETRETVYVVDDDPAILAAMRMVFEAAQRPVEIFADGETFLNAAPSRTRGCVLLDAKLPGISGLEVLVKLLATHPQLSTIMMTGQGDVKTAVLAMKTGAVDFVEKPFRNDELLACVDQVFDQSKDRKASSAYREKAAAQIASLTARQRQVMDLVLSGQPSKNIAADLGISRRTVENHRASIMEKTGTKSIPELVRLAIAAAEAHDGPP